MADNVFTYLGDDILNSTLLINTHFPSKVSNEPRLKSRLEKFSHRADRWPYAVVKAFPNRESPVYTQEQIVKINQSDIKDTDLIDKLRESVIFQFCDEIKRQKVLKQTLENRRDKVIEDSDFSFIDLSRETVRQNWDAYTRNMEETVWAQNKDTKLANLVNQKERCSERLSSLINQQSMIILLHKSKSERYWLFNNENCVLGFIPAINSHQQIVNSKIPPEHESSGTSVSTPRRKQLIYP